MMRALLAVLSLHGVAACARQAAGDAPQAAVASPASYGPPPTGAYLIPVLQDLSARFAGLRDVKDVGMNRPVPDTLDRGLFAAPFHGYRVCVAYDPMHTLGVFVGRRTWIYWLHGDTIVHVSRDTDGRCGRVPKGWRGPEARAKQTT